MNLQIEQIPDAINILKNIIKELTDFQQKICDATGRSPDGLQRTVMLKQPSINDLNCWALKYYIKDLSDETNNCNLMYKCGSEVNSDLAKLNDCIVVLNKMSNHIEQ